ncbi:hypothetical protein AB0467_13305 [Streptomyces sp. NPDC052095]|uniref:hypothetical protein n=1 Tax=unclassified Streptomyces TaxID=2593676 RepID=UPI00344C2A4A
MGSRRAAGLLVAAAVLPLTGCGGSTGDGAEESESTAAAVKAARAYQRASLDQDWRAVCEGMTERLRRRIDAKTLDACVETISAPGISDHRDARMSTGTAFDIEAFGKHPAGIGLRVTVDDGPGRVAHTALRLVPGKAGAWLVDQAVNLPDPESTGPTAVREALRRK